jgi:4-carboxymuconolactone decarboxylase
MTERFPTLELEDLDAEQRRAIEPVLQYTGGISGPFNATLRSARLTEMAILISARVSGSQYEWYAHHRRAREEGLAEEICTALAEGRRPESMTEEEAALFAFSVEQLTAPQVSDAAFERATAVFGERGVVELSYLLGFYGMIAGVLKAAAVTPPGAAAPLRQMDAPFA